MSMSNEGMREGQTNLPGISFLAALLSRKGAEQQLTAAAIIRGLLQQQGRPRNANRVQEQLPYLCHNFLLNQGEP